MNAKKRSFHSFLLPFILPLFCFLVPPFSPLFTEQKKERECMQLRIGVLRSELERQRKALGREVDLRQKERAQLQKKGKMAAHTTDRLRFLGFTLVCYTPQ